MGALKKKKKSGPGAQKAVLLSANLKFCHTFETFGLVKPLHATSLAADSTAHAMDF